MTKQQKDVEFWGMLSVVCALGIAGVLLSPWLMLASLVASPVFGVLLAKRHGKR